MSALAVPRGIQPGKLCLYGALTLVALLYLTPLFWMFVTSLKTDAEAVARVPTFWPDAPTTAA